MVLPLESNAKYLLVLIIICGMQLGVKVTKSSKRHKLKKKNFPGLPIYFQHAAVSSDNQICSEMGKSILLKGGSAVDSAITVQLCIEVVNCHSTGIGGGGFMLVYDKKKGKSIVIDFRETLPLKYKDNEKKLPGELILVPGVLRGLEKAHKKYGKLKWKELFEPVIALCSNGHAISHALSKAIESKSDMIMNDETLSELFAPNGNLLTEGNTLKRPKLAKTFKKIAENGADVFYIGEIAKQIVKEIKAAGGFISRRDLKKYKAVARKPLKTFVKGLEMLSLPAPGSGALVSLALKIMAGFNWTREDMSNHNKAPLIYHQIVEAFKFSYAPNTFLGDPKFTNHTKDVMRYMLDDKVAEILRRRIDNSSHTVDYYGAHSTEPPEDKRGTTHISILGPDGDAVALTSTINGYFGSKLLSKELGFFYNNELADFSEFWPHIYDLKPDKKVPGKRPMSNASPIIFLDQNRTVKGVFGAAGGHFIPTALTMAIGNWLFFGDTLKDAIAKPRLHCQLFPPTVVYESGFPSHLIQPLRHFNHSHVTDSTYDVTGQQNAAMGVIQAIIRHNDGSITAEADDRKGGKPSGY